MRILLVNQFYWPDVAATAQHLTDLAESLAHSGHEVHVLCGRWAYTQPTAQRPGPHEVHAGVTIRRLWVPQLSKDSGFGRMVGYAIFHLLVGLWILSRGRGFDRIVTLTTPPLIGIWATALKLFSRRPLHVCWAMDLHPDAEFALGMWSRRNPLWRFLDWLNGAHFRRADGVVALGERMKDLLVKKGVSPDHIHVISVWSRTDWIQPIEAQASTLRREQGLEAKFVVMYSGNAGLVHDFEAVCEAMLQLRHETKILFLFTGGGARIVQVQEFVHRHHLPNFLKLAYVPADRLGDLLGAGDVHLLTLRDGMAGIVVPSKLYGIMAAGRATIHIGCPDSDTADHLQAAEGGLVIGLRDGAGLVAALRRLADDPAECRVLGANAHRAFLERHERGVCCRQWLALLEQAFE